MGNVIGDAVLICIFLIWPPLEQNAFLQETAEEWEQCERKLKDVRVWIEKTGAQLDSVPHKKKPLRDQLGLCEKFTADTSIQKSKISMSVEKLQVRSSLPHTHTQNNCSVISQPSSGVCISTFLTH